MALKLSGEQKVVLTLPQDGVVLIKGGAGSGKTLVAVKRAECIVRADMFQAPNVAIFTYTKELVSAISSMVDSGAHIEVYGLDSWLFSFLSLDYNSFIEESKLNQFRMEAREVAFIGNNEKAIARKSDDFYCAEIRWIKGCRFTTFEQYKNTRRTGRGTEDRVTQGDRELLWKMYEEYNRRLKRAHIQDWDDRVLDALKKVEAPGFVPPFSHIVIDEAQDFSFSRIQLLCKLAKSITIVADAAQSIYQRGFTWADLGINIRGRSVELTHNYRNTKQIAEAAYSLLSHESDKDEFTKMLSATREGSKPLVLTGSSEWSKKKLVEMIRGKDDYAATVVAVPVRRLVKEYKRFFCAIGIPVRVSMRNQNFADRAVTIMTYHSLKGLQFKHVFLLELSASFFPSVNIEPYEVSKTRKLIYVAMTRACDDLTIFTGLHPSSFLCEIKDGLIDRESEVNTVY